MFDKRLGPAGCFPATYLWFVARPCRICQRGASPKAFFPNAGSFKFLVQLRSFEHVFPKRGILVVSALGFRVRTCQLVCPGAVCSARALNAKEKRQDFASCFEPMQLPKRRLSGSFLPKYWVCQVIGPAPELQKHVFPKRGILVVSVCLRV